ncbi:hypothetical protein AN963_28730 [Brevibacillus choshinensis]|uniref:Uncharacterized protein n=1 Tax=Brevibacillus choshinensis TaxID=54911 RepID=A0ABR5MZZ7_BRECH|nr:hypothetical protein AN963_28730 [Brevibacillus choshinensis]
MKSAENRHFFHFDIFWFQKTINFTVDEFTIECRTKAWRLFVWSVPSTPSSERARASKTRIWFGKSDSVVAALEWRIPAIKNPKVAESIKVHSNPAVIKLRK